MCQGEFSLCKLHHCTIRSIGVGPKFISSNWCHLEKNTMCNTLKDK